MILLWGKPGSGKTPFVTSYGEGMQFIDCDDGLLSSKTLVDKWQPDRQKIDVIQCLENDPNKAEAFNKVKRAVNDIYTQCTKKTYPYKVVAIDSFTTLADFALRQICGNSGKLNQPGGVSQQMWGLAISELDNLFIYLKAIPLPKVVIFHDRETTEGTGENQVTVQEISIFGKNLPRKIISYFDEVMKVKVRTVSGKMEPYLQTMPDAFTVVRSRGAIKDGFKTELGLRELLNQLGWKS
jgi:hypothetical protein